MANKMTYREFYTTVINFEGMTPEMVEFAKGAIATLDRKNASRTGKKSDNNAVWRDRLVDLLTANGDMTAKAIAKAFTDMGYGDDEDGVSTQKVNAIVKSFTTDTIKVYKAKDSKKNMVNFYGLNDTSPEMADASEISD